MNLPIGTSKDFIVLPGVSTIHDKNTLALGLHLLKGDILANIPKYSTLAVAGPVNTRPGHMIQGEKCDVR